MLEPIHPVVQRQPKDFELLLSAYGINANQSGCIMLDLEPIDIEPILDDPMIEFYTAPTADNQPWVAGPVSGRGAHVTLLYGLVMPEYRIPSSEFSSGVPSAQIAINSRLAGHYYADAVYKLLQDLELDLHGPRVQDIEVFSNVSEYSVLVARVDDERLKEANRRLRWLPHIDTFIEFKAHVTLAYLKPEGARLACDRAQQALFGRALVPAKNAINLGGELK